MNHSYGIAIESVVAVLLLLTLGYCMLLNRRLKRLKADEQSLKATIGELITATEIAERAIGVLKQTVRDVNDDLGQQLEAASEMSRQLNKHVVDGNSLFRRLQRIAIAARPGGAVEAEAETEPKMSAAKAIVAAAQAFSDRKRPDVIAA